MPDIDTGIKEMVSTLNAYPANVAEAVKKAAKARAEAAAGELKRESPKRKATAGRRKSGGKSFKPGAYANGWVATVEENTPLRIKNIVANKKHYQLTHLLENGHLNRGGGRVAARVHIAPVEEKVIQKLPKDIEEEIQKL